MKFSFILFFTVIISSGKFASGQYYDTGQDPASLKWLQIKTGRFTVIYPEKYDSGGIEFAKSLDDAYSKLISLYPERKFKIPVIIHNYSTGSNGYVAWAPRRMEIYPTPEQNTIPLDPNRQLAIHELTHVFQMESLNRGFSKAMSLVTGEQFTGVIASLIPLWFFEGDAVYAESALTESGRGRTPSFQKQLKAITVEKGGMYKYDKIANGSYRDFIPDHYQSGYQMVTWALLKYDHQIWNRVLRYTAEQPFTFNPVNISLLKTAGLTKKKLFKETFDTLKTIWTKDVTGDNALVYKAINPPKQGKYINYYSPVFAGTDSIIVIKTSLSYPSSFVLINPSERTEKKIHIPGQMYPWLISCNKGKIVWVEFQADQRWENRNYSVIKKLDIRTGKTKRLTNKSRYLAAVISPDGDKIAAIENTISNSNNLVMIDAGTGEITETVPAPGNVFLQQPQWSEEGEKITVIYLTEEGEGIMSYTLRSHIWKKLIEPGREDLQSAFLRSDSLFFISSLSGTDNVYLRTPDLRITSVTRSRFGTTDICLTGDKIFFSDYTSLGNDICTTTIDEAPVRINEYVSSSSFLINRSDIKPESSDIISSSVYTPEPYRKWQHLFRFHSWMPFYADIEEVRADPSSVRPGISILSQNSLSTLISSVGYEYTKEKNHMIHSRITWEGWYPVFESQLDYGDDPLIYKMGETVGNPADIQPGLRFSNSVSLPLQFSSGKFSEYLRPSITTDYRNKYIYIKDDGSYDYGQTIISGRFYFTNYHRSVKRDIYPRWAQTFDLNYSFAPFDKKIYGTAITVKSSFFLPGFFPNNGIKFRIEKEKQDPATGLLMGNRVLLPRGYNHIFPKEIDFLSVDYVLPLVYPDLNVSSLLYLKRIRAGLFYDYASGPGSSFYKITANGLTPLFNHSAKETFKSFGFELMADFHILRIPFMISGGVQSAWKNFRENPSLELLFNIDLYGMTIGRTQM